MTSLLAARDTIGFDDLALVVFFLIVAALKVLQKVLARRAPRGEPAEERREPPGEKRAGGPADRGAARGRPRGRAPAASAAPAPRRVAPAAPHLADLGRLPPEPHADLRGRAAEPSPLGAARPTGRALLLAADLAPPDRLRQAWLWTEVFRRPRPVLPPPRAARR